MPSIKLVKKEFFWDVRVIHASSASDKNDVLFTLTLNTVDDYGQEQKIMVEMGPKDLDKCIAALKQKI